MRLTIPPNALYLVAFAGDDGNNDDDEERRDDTTDGPVESTVTDERTRNVNTGAEGAMMMLSARALVR